MTTDVVPFGQAVRAWLAISLQTFGGPAGQIAVMERELVEQRGWISHRRFLHALSYCTLLPGPEAQQLATYVGWLLNGVRGGLVAGGLFVLPGFVALLALSAAYVAYGESGVVTALFAGIAPAVLVIVCSALLRLGSRALTHASMRWLAVAAFVALTLLAVPFPLVILVAAVVGAVVGRLRPGFTQRPQEPGAETAGALVDDDAVHTAPPTARHAAVVLGIGALAWGVPVGLVALLLGGGSVLVDQATFFTGTALVTFGGAYAVLAFVAQRAVEVYGWLAPGEMVRGLALAESTPGPLVMVVQFVAFLGAYRDPGQLDPWVAGVLASVLVTWVTFVPSFVFIFLGAPYVERLRGNALLASALAGVTAAVVGVIASLGYYFAVHTLFDRSFRAEAGVLSVELPRLATLDPVAVGVTAVAAVLLLVRGWSPLRTLAACAGVGLALGASTTLL